MFASLIVIVALLTTGFTPAQPTQTFLYCQANSTITNSCVVWTGQSVEVKLTMTMDLVRRIQLQYIQGNQTLVLAWSNTPKDGGTVVLTHNGYTGSATITLTYSDRTGFTITSVSVTSTYMASQPTCITGEVATNYTWHLWYPPVETEVGKTIGLNIRGVSADLSLISWPHTVFDTESLPTTVGATAILETTSYNTRVYMTYCGGGIYSIRKDRISVPTPTPYYTG